MITTRRRKHGRYALLLALSLALIGYFAHHAVEGDHGLHRRASLTETIGKLEAELAALKEQRLRIEHDVALVTKRVREEPDLLDEQARALLHFVGPGDIVVIKPVASSAP